MFNWFGAKCPVDRASREWVEGRTSWLIGQFGLRHLEYCKVILPTAEFFPEPFDGSIDAARRIFAQTCGYVGVDPRRIELKFYRDGGGQVALNTPLVNRAGSAGLYDASGGQTTIWLEKSQLDDPERLVATSAHELCHARLLGEKRVSGDEEDMEPLTDLATVFFGLGVFTANAVLRDRSSSAAGWETFRISRHGYLTAPLWGYALALFAQLRNETSPAWSRYLRPDVRSPCGKGLAYLGKDWSSDALIARICGGSLAKPGAPTESSRGVYSTKASTMPADAAAAGPENPVADEEAGDDGPEERYLAGILHLQRRRWSEALAAFSFCIEHDPDDAEALQQRSLVFGKLGMHDRALADAERAVELEEDEPDAYWARGTAYFHASDFARAIADFSRYIDGADAFANRRRSAKGYLMRGRARAGLGDFKAAVADYSMAIRRVPTWAEPYGARAEVYARLGLEAKAKADLEETKRLAQS